jgi:[acyl-carrier-protein] S-malonyltransferase
MVKSVTLLFPGQGSQYVGMGKNLDQALFDKGNEILGYDLKKMMQEGPDDELKLTHNTQPAILKHSITLFKVL